MLLRRALESIHPIQVTSTCCETNVRWVHRRVSRTIARDRESLTHDRGVSARRLIFGSLLSTSVYDVQASVLLDASSLAELSAC